MKYLFKKIAVGLLTLIVLLLPLSALYGAAPQFFAGGTYNLAGSGVSKTATSITLQSLTIRQTSQEIVTADLVGGVGDKFYLTIEPGNATRQEIVSCTTVTQSPVNNMATLSGCSRGLSVVTPYTASTTLAFTHGGGAQVIFSDAPQVFDSILDYIDAASVAGAVDASLAAKGVIEVATGAEAASTTGVGGGSTSAPLALTTAISTSTFNSAALASNKVVVTKVGTGKIDDNLISTSTLFTNMTLKGTTTIADNRSVLDSSGNGLLWTFLASTSLTSTGSALTVPPRTFLRVYINTGGFGGSDFAKVSFNGDTGINYAYNLTGTSTGSGTYAAGATGIAIATAGTTGSTNIFDIFNPSSTLKQISGTYSGFSATTTNGLTLGQGAMAAVWGTSTAQQITNIRVQTSGGQTFTAPSTMYVFGSSF